MNSVFAQYEELSSPQFAVINLSLRLRLITANFGLDNSSYRAQPQLVERRSSNSKVAGSRPSHGRRYLSACAGYGNYETHTREHFLLIILRSEQ